MCTGGGDSAQLKDLLSQMQQLRGLGTWTSTTVQKVGHHLLNESSQDPRLLQDMKVPHSSQPLLSIISNHFKGLKKQKKEVKVQEIYFKLFKELRDEVSRTSSNARPCFQIHDTSDSEYLKNPIAKVGHFARPYILPTFIQLITTLLQIDFTFTCNPEVVWPEVVWFAGVFCTQVMQEYKFHTPT